MIKFCRIMVWISVVMTVASLGVLVYEVASAGNWVWVFPSAMWGISIFTWRNLFAQEVRSRDLRASYGDNYYINR